MKKYVNAKTILPDSPIEEIQKYVQGTYVYIPKTERNSWGTSTGTRDEFLERNEQIRKRYNNGFEISDLVDLYGLSEERIRAITYGFIYPIKQQNKDLLDVKKVRHINKLEAIKLFQEKSQHHKLPLVVIDAKTDIVDENNILFFYCKSNLETSIDWESLELDELFKELSEMFEHMVGIREA